MNTLSYLKYSAVSALLSLPLTLSADWSVVVDFEDYAITSDESAIQSEGWVFQDWDFAGFPDCAGTVDCTGVREIVSAPYGGNGKSISIRALNPDEENPANARAIAAFQMPSSAEVPLGGEATFYLRFAFEGYQLAHHFGLTTKTEPVSGSGEPRHNYSDLGPGVQVALHQAIERDTLAAWEDYQVHFWADATLEPDLDLEPGIWYELWFHIRNLSVAEGGGYYDLYIRGGDFGDGEPMYLPNPHDSALDDWGFRDKQDKPLVRFLTISNGYSADVAAGIAGDAIYFDDMYIDLAGKNLTTPDSTGTPTWAGLPIVDGWVVAGTKYFGWLNVVRKPWLYCLSTESYVYFPESYYSASGSWAYFLDYGEVSDVGGSSSTGWYFDSTLDTWVFIPGDPGAGSGWIYVIETGA